MKFMTKGKGNSRRVVPLSGKVEVKVNNRPALYKIGTYLGNIQRDKYVNKLAPKIYGGVFTSFDTGSKKQYTINDILGIWDAGKHKDKMLEVLSRFADVHDNSVIVLSVETVKAVEGYPVKKYPDMQRLLYYESRDKDTGESRGNGGVLFQGGEMSFHS